PDLRSLVGNPDVFESDHTPEPIQPTEDSSPDDLWDAARKRLNQVWEMPSTAEPSEPPSEPLNQPNSNTSGDSEERFTTLGLTRIQAIKLIQQLRTELNQTQIIERLWQVSKGGSAAWKEAYAQFKDLMGGTGDE
ncbi:MAG: hypothetical protein AB1589_33345, partial [Cyanobacteriota bacterium]